MNRDISRSKANNEYVFDAQNIRFTAREGETLLSVTEKREPRPGFSRYISYQQISSGILNYR